MSATCNIQRAGDYTFRLTRRQRADGGWRCWVDLGVCGGFTLLGDAWPMATPRADELVNAARRWFACHVVTECR